MPQKVEVEHLAESVYLVCLDRPLLGNALDPDSITSLDQHLTTAESDPKYSVFAISATGSAFCAGADVAASKKLMENPDDLLQFFKLARSLMLRLHSTRLVSVAVVAGLAAAGGLEMVAACNVVIASESATFADRHARYGFIPSFGGTALLPLKIGYAQAAWLMLADGKYSAREAHATKLVSQVFEDAQFQEESINQLNKIGALNSAALAPIKKLLNHAVEISLAFDRELSEVERHLQSGGYSTRFIDF
jgi:enoyl-CoA hydratase/carnithine racemase